MVENAKLNKYVTKLEAKNLIYETYLQGLDMKLEDVIMQKARKNVKKQQDAQKSRIAELENQLKSLD